MSLTIRSETPADYAAIADVTARAFGNRAAEAAIVGLTRQTPAFDRELSLVAESDGRVVGHVLFVPHILRLMGEDVPAVKVGPVSVAPGRQGQGIGRQLIETGHEIARSKGQTAAMLVGHPTYYPRFGYITGAYGTARTVVTAPEGEGIETRPVAPKDLDGLVDLWEAAEGDLDFSLRPDPDLLEWISPNPEIASTVYLRDSVLAGYTRIHSAKPAAPRVFLARPAHAEAVAAEVARAAGTEEIVLPVHPSSPLARLGKSSVTAFPAAMARSLGSRTMEEYLAEVTSGNRLPGSVTWPTSFEI